MLVSRTGYTGDLGYELWVPAADALTVWDAVWDGSRGQGVIPIGMTALYMARIEAGLVLLDVDFHSSRFAWTDADRTTPIELGPRLDAPGPRDRRSRRSSAATRSGASSRGRTSRWKLSGLVVDWRDYDRIYDEAGLIPPKDHTPIQDEYYVYDDDLNQLGYATSQMYSPMLQRHIALARVPLDRSAPGSRVKLELAVNHRYEYFDADVARTAALQPRAKDRLTCRRRPTPKAATPIRQPAANVEGRPDLRRDRHRRRPQRPDQRRLPRQGRPAARSSSSGATSSAARRSPRSCGRASGSRRSRTR